MHPKMWILWMMLLWVLPGCGEERELPLYPASCREDRHCPAPEACRDGLCVESQGRQALPTPPRLVDPETLRESLQESLPRVRTPKPRALP